jgi:hypothetical protein
VDEDCSRRTHRSQLQSARLAASAFVAGTAAIWSTELSGTVQSLGRIAEDHVTRQKRAKHLRD